MQEYDLGELIDKPKGSEHTLPPTHERAGGVIEYNIALVLILREIMREYRATVLPSVKNGVISESTFIPLKSTAKSISETTALKAKKVFEAEHVSHTRRFWQGIKTKFKLDLSAFIKPTDNHALLKLYLEKNTSLITSMTNDMVKRVEQTVYSAKINKTSTTELSKILQKEFKIMKSRADLIAVDQLSKLNADFNRARQEQGGIKKYTWRGRLDSRERSLHVNLEGNVYKWGQKTGAEGGLPPSQPIRCRCWAQAVVVSS